MSAPAATPDAPTATPAPAGAIDRAQLRVLLRLFFKLNFRGHLARGMSRGGEAKTVNPIWIMCIYTFFGLVVGFPLSLACKDPLSYLSIIFTFTLMMGLMIAITESSQVLFNPQEEDVLGHRPIPARTLLLAKALNLLGITLMVTLALNVAPTFFTLRYAALAPWAPLVHILAVALLSAFAVACVVFLYGLLTRWVGPEKFQAVVTWTQIVMMVMATMGYQLISPLVGSMGQTDLTQYLPYVAPLPPVWFAAFEVTAGGTEWTPAVAALGLLGLGVTVALGWGALTRMATLQGGIAGAAAERAGVVRPPRPEKTESTRPVRLNPLLAVWLRDPVERAIFRLTATMLRRDRFIMQQVYPQLAFILVYPVIMVFSGGGGRHAGSPGGPPPGSFFIYFGVWMLSMLPTLSLEVLRMSENCDAAVIFAIAPLSGTAALFHGTRKAVLYYLVLPTAVLLAGVFAVISPDPLRDVLTALPMFVLLPTLALLPGLSGGYIPLSQPPKRGDKAGRFALMFGSMFMMAILGGISAILSHYRLTVYGLAVEIPIVWLINRAILRTIAARQPIRAED